MDCLLFKTSELGANLGQGRVIFSFVGVDFTFVD
jgi:hypothetical protein